MSRGTFMNSVGEGRAPANSVVQANQTNTTPSRFSRLFLEDGSYIRIKNCTAGLQRTPYTRDLSLRLYLNAVNLATFTKYKGYDPEVSAFENANMRGVDSGGSYPQSRTISTGANVTF